ncbi:MAG: hypothetical protein IKC01_02795 [Clostridia bacterium]|nr:hypothetical protein [Clostridia bacterium]
MKNSTKLQCVSVCLLLVSNVIFVAGELFPAVNEKIGILKSAPQIVMFVFPLLSYLALNDEKAAHRKTKDIKSQKIIRFLKGSLVFIFVISVLKSVITHALSSFNGVFSYVLSGVMAVVSSYSFFVLLLSLWYFVRDKKEGNIKYISLFSLVVSVFFALFKMVINIFPCISTLATSPILQLTDASYVQNAVSVFQYTANIIMLFALTKHFAEKELHLSEERESEISVDRPEVYECISDEKGYGIDFVDDAKNMRSFE